MGSLRSNSRPTALCELLPPQLLFHCLINPFICEENWKLLLVRLNRRISALSDDIWIKIFTDQFIGIILIPKNENITSELTNSVLTALYDNKRSTAPQFDTGESTLIDNSLSITIGNRHNSNNEIRVVRTFTRCELLPTSTLRKIELYLQHDIYQDEIYSLQEE